MKILFYRPVMNFENDTLTLQIKKNEMLQYVIVIYFLTKQVAVISRTVKYVYNINCLHISFVI